VNGTAGSIFSKKTAWWSSRIRLEHGESDMAFHPFKFGAGGAQMYA